MPVDWQTKQNLDKLTQGVIIKQTASPLFGMLSTS
jgi:hypothetical protein